MNIRVREAGSINIIDIEGRIDINSSEIIEIIGWLLKNSGKDILLNFDKVDMVDYSGISILAIAYKNVINHSKKMKFCNVAIHIEQLFSLVRLDSIFEIYKDEETALKEFYLAAPIDKKQLRRRFTRLDVSIEMEFCAVRDLKSKGAWQTGKLLNLGGDGIFLYTKKLLPIGEDVRLKIDLHKGKPVEIEGLVVWLADKSLQPQSYPGMGIHFKDMPKQSQDRILEFINRHMTHRSATL